MEIGYAGERGTNLLDQRYFNQANLATPTNPIRGQTTSTLSNVSLRVPFEGVTQGSSIQETVSGSWYNSLQATLRKRFSNGLQFLASYTFARDLTTSTGASTGAQGGLVNGDQDNPKSRYGPDNFIRPHRFVVNYVYNLPSPKDPRSAVGRLLGGWQVSGVTTIQSGQPLDFTYQNGVNLSGITNDRPSFAPGCSPGNFMTSGSVQSRLQGFFKGNCFTKPAVISSDGGTAFGNVPNGIGRGPDQNNYDISLTKETTLPWPKETSSIEFRAEFFNAFNHPQFNNPDTSFNDAPIFGGLTFGHITSTLTNPRIVQFALKWKF
jgi:hypothetical protein